MPAQTLKEKVKLALRITTTAFDSEVEDLIQAALLDLGIAGVYDTTNNAPFSDTTTDSLVIRAVVTYCKIHFGEPDEFDRLKKSYDEQKAQLQTATGYTIWISQTP